MDLNGKVAVITGGGRGIGAATARKFASSGAKVVVAARTSSEIDEVARSVGKLGAECLAVPTDVTIKRQVEGLVDAAVKEFGRVDVLVNNAGIAIHNPVSKIRVEDWDLTMAVNLRGVFLCTQAVFQGMCDREEGHIVNISSISGVRGHTNGGAYCASKFAVVGFTQVTAVEGKPYGVKASVVCPGPVDTRMRRDNHPNDDVEKLPQPETIADTIHFLVSQPPEVHTPEAVVQAHLM